MIVEGLVGSLRSLSWVVMLLMLMIYLFAIICVEVIGHEHDLYPGYVADSEGLTLSLSYSDFNNYEYFGTLRRAMFTLFGISLLADWESLRPVWEFQPWFT